MIQIAVGWNTGQRAFRVCADPTCELRTPHIRVLFECQDSFVQTRHQGLSCECFGRRGFAACEGRTAGGRPKLGIRLKAAQPCQRLFGHCAGDPRLSHRLGSVEPRLAHFPLRHGNLLLGTLALQPPLLTVRKALHHTDLAHRHEVAGERVTIRCVDRKVVHARDQLRVRQSSGARRGSGGRIQHCRGCGNLRSLLQRPIDRILERQRPLLCRGRERTQRHEQSEAFPPGRGE